MGQLSDGYGWSGALGDVRAIFTRCNELRFSGRLELGDPAEGRTATAEFVGGEPLDVSQDELASWTSGSFKLIQAIPDLSGALTQAVELEGALTVNRPNDLMRHCEDSRLSADLFLLHADERRARIRFAHGRVESAQVDGLPELSALSKVAGWNQGRFRLVLRPLFAVDTPTPPPALTPPKPLAAGSFDFTGGVPLAEMRPVDRQPNGPPPVPHDDDEMPASATAITAAPLPAPRKSQAMRISSPRVRPERSVWPILLGATVLFIGVAAAAVWYFVIRPAGQLDSSTASIQPVLSATLTEPTPSTTKTPSTTTAGIDPINKKKVVEPNVPVRKAAASKPAAPAAPELDPKVAAIVDKGRRLLVQGHMHTAQDWFKKARRLAPDDEKVAAWEQAALGKTGKGELILEGKGQVTVAGEPIKSPRKLKLPAATYTVEKDGGVTEEVTVPKRGKVKVSVK